MVHLSNLIFTLSGSNVISKSKSSLRQGCGLREQLLNCFPVCGEVLQISDQLNSMIQLTLCFNEGTGNQVMTGGFITDKQASYGRFFKLEDNHIMQLVSSYIMMYRTSLKFPLSK